MGIVKINQAEAQVGVEVFFGSTALRKIKKADAKEIRAQNCLPTFVSTEGNKLIER